MKLRYVLYVIAVAIFISSCKRQPICDGGFHSNSAEIKISIDWSKSGLNVKNISNVSVYAYSADVAAPYRYVSGNIEKFSIYLPVGVYFLLLFNDFPGDVKGVDFKDSDSFDLFSAGVIEREDVTDIYYQIESGEQLAQELEPLAVWRTVGIEVTPEMISCNYCEDHYGDFDIALAVVPTAVTTQCVVDLGVDNLNNASYIEVTIRGFAAGVYLSSGERFSTPGVSLLFSVALSNRVYSDGGDGTAQGSLTTFGIAPESNLSYEVEINVILNNGELVTFTRDVTEQLRTQDNSIIYIDLTSEENRISLPRSDNLGFGVESWGDNEQVGIY